MGFIPILFLCIEGPMQSWGLRSKWDVRDTGTEPSKSGIIGLLGCALGYGRDDERLEKELDNNIRIAVREDRKGNIHRDFHTVMPDPVFTTADGKRHSPSSGGNAYSNTICSNRYYIDDAIFLVALSGPIDLLEKCKNALLHPAWRIYLGRKSCPPSRPVLECLDTTHASLEDAIRDYPWQGRGVMQGKLRCIVEDPSGDGVRNDATRSTWLHLHGKRRVKTIYVDPRIKEVTGE